MDDDEVRTADCGVRSAKKKVTVFFKETHIL